MNTNTGLGAIGSSIPAGLEALISAQKVLSQEASPTTPQGAPTIAGQMEQAIQQRLGQQPGMMPTDPFKEQLMKTLQMQAQQQMAQMGPQQSPEQSGIAQLPAPNMQGMKEGGVVGYDGTGTSQLVEPPLVAPDDPIKAMYEAMLKTSKDLEEEKAKQAPDAFTREMAYSEAEGEVKKKPWEQKREGIAQLAQQQAEILQRNKDLYNKEVEQRDKERLMTLLTSRGRGMTGAAALAFDQAARARDEAFTGKLMKDMEYTKSLLEAKNSANESEFKYSLEKALGKATDSKQAIDIFNRDKSIAINALRGLYGNQAQAWARAFQAEKGVEKSANATNMERYAQGYLNKRVAQGDQRDEATILQEGRDTFIAEQQRIQAIRAQTAQTGVGVRIMEEAADAAAKAIANAEKNPTSTLAKELRKAKTPEARAAIEKRELETALRNRGVDPSAANVDIASLLGRMQSKAAPAPAGQANQYSVTTGVAPAAPMPQKQSELKNGVVYQTARGPATWNAAEQKFFPVK